MTIRENEPRRADGTINIDDRNYITLGLTYQEFIDLRSLIKELLDSSTPGLSTGNRWVNEFLMVERNTRLALTLKKRLNKIN